MNTPPPKTAPTIGYMTVCEHADHGYFGGYLTLDLFGRPLEFHCTAPVLPSRAQEILYGPTLRPFLLGEQIGNALLGAAKLTPHVLLIDQVDLSILSHTSKLPVIRLVLDGSGSDLVTLAGHRLEFQSGVKLDQQAVLAQLEQFSQRVELDEPFDRISLAIHEAGRIGEDEGQRNADAA